MFKTFFLVLYVYYFSLFLCLDHLFITFPIYLFIEPNLAQLKWAQNLM